MGLLVGHLLLRKKNGIGMVIKRMITQDRRAANKERSIACI
jgi:hypothetical protein